MKKTSLKKLALRRETIEVFRETTLRTVAGGGPTAIDCSVTCLADNTNTTTRLCA